MSLWKKLFGEWEVESERFIVASYGSIFRSLNYDAEVMLVIEKNSKTGKRRAYTKDICGTMVSIDMDFVVKFLNPRA